MRKTFFIFACLILLLNVYIISVNATVILSTDFDNGIPSEFSGITNIESVQGYEGIGTGTNTFSGNFLRNTTGGFPNPSGTPGEKTILTLTNLPAHNSVDVHFLFASIDSWDGNSTIWGFDYFNVAIDGEII